jgi:hypothetical protein
MAVDISWGNFYGVDSILELIIIAVAGIIAYQSNRIYGVIKDKNYQLFSWAFISIAISFFFKILANITLTHMIKIQKMNIIYTLAYESKLMGAINFFSFVLYKAFFIFGFLIIFFILTKNEKRENRFLFTYFSILAIIFSIYFNFIFHLTLVIIIALLVQHFYENQKKVKTRNSILVFTAFSIILVSQIFFIFANINTIFYLLDEFILLVGFLILAVNHYLIKNEKTYKVRSDKGYVGGLKRK